RGPAEPLRNRLDCRPGPPAVRLRGPVPRTALWSAKGTWLAVGRQEAPQEDAQEEAQEAPEEDPLAATPAGEVASARTAASSGGRLADRPPLGLRTPGRVRRHVSRGRGADRAGYPGHRPDPRCASGRRAARRAAAPWRPSLRSG